MHVKSFLELDPCSESIASLVDWGELGRSKNVAKQALCGMIHGIRRNFQQLVSHVFITNSDPELLKEFLFLNIRAINETGLRVVAVIFDQASENCRLYKLIKVTEEKPFFYLDDKKIFSWPDTCHLLKSFRNLLYGNRVVTPDRFCH